MDKPSVYIETSIVSYLAADPSGHPVTLRNQQLTRAWWENHRANYALYTSDLTRDEARQGDIRLAAKRIALLDGIVLHPIDQEARALADALFHRIPLPPQAWADSLHIAVAAVHATAYLLTWNCKHIANPHLYRRIQRTCAAFGHTAPILITPAELMEG